MWSLLIKILYEYDAVLPGAAVSATNDLMKEFLHRKEDPLEDCYVQIFELVLLGLFLCTRATRLESRALERCRIPTVPLD